MEKIWLKFYPKDVPAEIDHKQYQSIVQIAKNPSGQDLAARIAR